MSCCMLKRPSFGRGFGEERRDFCEKHSAVKNLLHMVTIHEDVSVSDTFQIWLIKSRLKLFKVIIKNRDFAYKYHSRVETLAERTVACYGIFLRINITRHC